MPRGTVLELKQFGSRASRIALIGALAFAFGFVAPSSANAQINPHYEATAPLWVASIISVNNKGGWDGCSGSVVENAWILTAAHCVADVVGRNVKLRTQIKVAVGEITVGSGQIS